MIHISAICDTRAKSIWCSKATNKKTHIAVSQIQSPCHAMCNNPFIVHEFFCAQKRGTRRSAKREQTRIISRRGAQVASRSHYRIFRSCVTIMQQIDCNPQFGLRELSAPAQKIYFFSSFAIWCESRDTFRRAELRCTMPFCAARIKAGSASTMAAVARLRSPAAIASSTLRIAERMRERRDLLMTVRRAAWRAAFFADFVFAIRAGHKKW